MFHVLDPDVYYHLPSLKDSNGMMHVISLINLAELANVIEPDMYRPGGVSSQDQKFFIHVRMRARMLLA